jgi:hypothetical protein
MITLLVISMLVAVSSAENFCPSASDFIGMGSPNIFNGGWTHQGSGAVATKASFNLLGGSVEYDIDFTNVRTGVNANIYTVSPWFSGSFSQAAYCDAQKSGDQWCVEVDWIESNGNCGGQTTLHTRPGPGMDGCTAWGCENGYHYNGRTSFHMKITYDHNGVWTTYRDGQTIVGSSMNPSPQDQDWQALREQYSQRGAVIYSSQWAGWVPLADCGTSGDLGSSSFTVSNLRISGSVVQGPTPTLCSGGSPSNNNNGGNIQWNDAGNFAWATGCDFQGNDLRGVQSDGSQCGSTCQSTPGCTHFAWTPPSNCWLKQNGASKSNAVASSTNGIVCGLQLPTPPPPTVSSCDGISAAFDPNDRFWVEVNGPQNANLYVVCTNSGTNLYLSCNYAFGVKWQCPTNGQICQPDSQSGRYAVVNNQWCRLDRHIPRASAGEVATLSDTVASQDTTPAGTEQLPVFGIVALVIFAVILVTLLVIIVVLTLRLRK